ncbi:hypothetical protein A6B37_04850 [Achromobacter sp. HZ01]|nr:hypothetical protein A6B37_04850 [Achromobacter sp. HZ01]
MEFAFNSKRQGVHASIATGRFNVAWNAVFIYGKDMFKKTSAVDKAIEMYRIFFIPKDRWYAKIASIGDDFTQCPVVSLWMIGV